VGARTIRKRDDSVRKDQETLTHWTILAAVAFPMLLAVALVAMDMSSDLSELKVAGQVDGKGAVPVGWPDLARQHEVSGPIRMIGYMMDGYQHGYQPPRDGAMVEMFVLLPEAGQLLHPARRIPNQMVEVHPSHPVVFHYRDLVWAAGILRNMNTHGDGKADYSLKAAEVTPATERDVVKWFRP
jgi:hypothetical protein